ncbi:MAG: hypothetical protein NT030_00710 [Candidatus Saganbacteria bacterium]|jgi:hypothetical protein|nr:hypothetical protein [Candidatus Saganbacteria bacterium]
MAAEINENIQVGAIFRGSKIRPAWFVWEGRKYAVKDVTYSWYARDGDVIHSFFSVSDGVNLFEISFNLSTLNWKLVSVK